jgi:hypothetical protein
MILLAISLVAFGSSCNWQNRAILDRWETRNSALAIRVTQYQEKHFPLSKFRYVFEGKSENSDGWIQIMTTSANDDVPIPRDQIRFISNQAAYIFMSDKYAITTNGGLSWFVWRTEDGQRQMKYPGQFFIKDVSLKEDGQGTLVLASRSSDTAASTLQTSDFGHSWKAQ